MWPAALSLGLAAGVALVLGTLGYAVVGFAVLTACTNTFGCTQTSCPPCRPAQTWLTAGALGQAALVAVAVVLLVVAAVRPRARHGLAVAGWALVLVAAAWVVATTAVASTT